MLLTAIKRYKMLRGTAPLHSHFLCFLANCDFPTVLTKGKTNLTSPTPKQISIQTLTVEASLLGSSLLVSKIFLQIEAQFGGLVCLLTGSPRQRLPPLQPPREGFPSGVQLSSKNNLFSFLFFFPSMTRHKLYSHQL